MSSLNEHKKNFSDSLAQLDKYLKSNPKSDLEKAGIIKSFELCFECLWKLFQKMAGEQGLNLAGPRDALKFAFKSGIIFSSDETQWLQMLKDRNLAVHVYKQDLADQIFERIKISHIQLLQKVKT